MFAVTVKRFIALATLATVSGPVVLLSPAPVAAARAELANRASYVFFAEGVRSSTMSGSMADIDRARALRVGNEALLYFQQGGAAYVIRDPATLRQAEAIL